MGSPGTSSDDNRSHNGGRALPGWYPKCGGVPILQGNMDALGWTLAGVGQTVVVIGIAAFLMPAVMDLAKLEAGCEIEIPLGETQVPDCEGTLYLGMKPSSLITALNSILGVLTIVLIPLMGAVVDHSKYRRGAGRVSSILFLLCVSIQLLISEDTWFPLLIALVLSLFFGWMNTMLYYSYLPELTDDPDVLSHLSKISTVCVYSGMIFYICSVLILAVGLGVDDDSVAVAQLGLAMSIIVTGVLLVVAWGPLLGERPAAHELPEGTSLLTIGFQQIYNTAQTIFQDSQYHALKWLYIGVSFGDAGLNALGVVVVTFLIDQLNFTSTETGIAALVMLISSIPGGIMGAVCLRWMNPKKSVTFTMGLLMAVTTVAALLLRGPDQQIQAYMCVGGWGFLTGWKFTCDRIVIGSILPEGQEAELMGFYIFAGNILVWFPSILFTALNEAGVPLRLSIFLINVPFFLTILCYNKMGHYDDAVAAANRVRLPNSELKKGSEEDVTAHETAHSRSIDSLPISNETKDVESTGKAEPPSLDESPSIDC